MVAKVVGTRLAQQRVVAEGELAQPDFTPRGNTISFLRASGDAFTLCLVNPDGSRLKRVPGVPSTVDARWRPVWVP